MSQHAATKRKPRVLRGLFHLACVGVVGVAAFAVPLPYIEYTPGGSTDIPPLIEIDGTDVTELDGSTQLLTIMLRQQATIPALLALADSERSLVPTSVVYGPNTNRDDARSAERARFGRQFHMAAVVGARAAGVEAEADTEVTIFSVAPESPAAGLLRRGDVVLTINDETIDAAEQVPRLVQEASPGDDVDLTIRRGDDVEEVTVTVEAFGPDDVARLGVQIETTVGQIELPFEITLAETKIGGPSAGMMVALTVYDLLVDEDLLAGRTIMGTGTVDADGRVGPVGGIRQKMQVAAEEHAELVLVPQSQYDDATGAVDADVPIVGVSSIDDAIDVLRDKP